MMTVIMREWKNGGCGMKNKGKIISLFVSDDLKEKIQEAASEEGLTLSAWIRRLIILTLKEKDE